MLASKITEAMDILGWDNTDDIVVEIGGTAVSGIHQREDANPKWSAPYGTRKYNKDAFIVIKNRDRSPFEPSKPNPDLVAHHGRLQPTEEAGTDVPPNETDNTGHATGQHQENS